MSVYIFIINNWNQYTESDQTMVIFCFGSPVKLVKCHLRLSCLSCLKALQIWPPSERTFIERDFGLLAVKDERRSTKIKPCPLVNILFQLEIRHLYGNKDGRNLKCCRIKINMADYVQVRSLLIQQRQSTVVGGACKVWCHTLQILWLVLWDTAYDLLGLKRRCWQICIIIGGLCTHTTNTYLCSNNM